jgi:aspS_bact: aspartyl-tRNA synthetase
MHWRTS